MTNHIEVDETYVKSLLENAAWGKANIKLSEKTSPVEQEITEEPTEEEAAVIEEAPESHSCPLCESSLENDLSDEVIFEHINMVQSLLQALTEEEAEESDEVDEMQEKKKDDGESKGDKGKDKKDPDAKDYEDGGDRKGDDKKKKMLDKVAAMKSKAAC